MDHDYSAGPGVGLVIDWLMFVFAAVFGVMGFVACMIWRTRRQGQKQLSTRVDSIPLRCGEK
jgi:uncharacterized iron-regulated membrane protein